MRIALLVLEKLDVDAREFDAQLHHPCFEPGVLACVPASRPKLVGWEGEARDARLVGETDASLARNRIGTKARGSTIKLAIVAKALLALPLTTGWRRWRRSEWLQSDRRWWWRSQ